MTLNEAVRRAELYCNADVEKEIEVGAVNKLESRLCREVYSRYPDLAVASFGGYDADRDGAKELMAEPPYDEMYPHYIAAEAYLILHEQEQYNNHLFIFNAMLNDYKVYLNKNHRPGGVKRYGIR